MNILVSRSRLFLFMVLGLLIGGVEALASSTASQNMTKSQMPKGLWQAFSEARHAVELNKEKKEDYSYKAYNPKNRYGIQYGEQGLKLQKTNWEFGMTLQAYGQDAALAPVRKATLHVKGNKIIYDRGTVCEWYINDTKGLEQGFTLHKPKNYDTEKELILSLVLKGGLIPKWKIKGESISFYKNNTKAFDYEKLKAFDNKGKVLTSRLALKENTLQILVDTKDAQWPVTVDPVFSTEQKVVSVTSDAVKYGRFAYAVALSGDTALIGTPYDDDGGTYSGSAYVMVKTLAGWVAQAKLIASDASAEDYFGRSVALDGDTALIGVYGDDDGGTNSGSAYVFTRSGTTWSQQTKLIASDPTLFDQFGWSVALDGDTALIGADVGDNGIGDSGSAYVFTRSGTTWTEQAKLTAWDAAADDNFAYSVALSGDTALIGTPYNDDRATDSGSAYIFTRSGTIWKEQQKLTAVDAAAGDYFGYAVALKGDTAVIGAYFDDDDFIGENTGSAYIFTNNEINGSTVWKEQQKLTASDAEAFDNFGKSVALDGNITLIGALYDDDNGSGSGSAYIFTRSGTTWTEQQKLIASDAYNSDLFGNSVALEGDTALVGAAYDNDGVLDSGSAYVFTLMGTTWTEEQKLTATASEAGDMFGASISLDGDTALVGAVNDYDGGPFSGSVYVFTRLGDNWAQQDKLTASDATGGDQFGISVALDGDTALVGAWNNDEGGTNSGSAYIFTRSGTTWTQQAKLLASDPGNYDNFGNSVALDGDTALIAAELDDNSWGTNSGTVYVFIGSGANWTEQAKLTASDAVGGDQFGHSVALDGDTALVGATNDYDITNSGSAYIFTRSGTVWTEDANLSASDASGGDQFGISVALDGDTALVGAAYDDDGGTNSGSAYIFTRSGRTWTQQAKLTASDAADVDQFGNSVALIGNTALIGAWNNDDGGSNSGSAYIFTRSGTIWTEYVKLMASDAAGGDKFGKAVALNGDTSLIGALSDDDGGTDSGSAYFNRFECGFTGPIIANTWTMIGLPCAPDSNVDTVGGLFGDTLDVNAYYTRWIVYRYNVATNSYEQLQLTDTVSQGEGYWLLSYDDSYWDAPGSLTSYPVTQAEGCASADGCYAIDLVLPDSATSRHNLVGFPNNIDIDWSQVRFVLDDGTTYTPSQAETNNIASKTIWKWNGSSYDTYDDSTPGMLGTLSSHEGFWIQLLSGSFSETSVKLMIPAK